MTCDEKLQELRERYRQYDEPANAVKKKSSMFDGFLGFGNDPRRDPCHGQFYEDVGNWMQAFLTLSPQPQQAYDAAYHLITAPRTCATQESYWMMYAAQGWCRQLVDRLDSRGCAGLQAVYDELYPKRDRLPVHEELYKMLKKGAQHD